MELKKITAPFEVTDESPNDIEQATPSPITSEWLSSNNRTSLKVSRNTTIEIPLENIVSNLSCSSNIGSVSSKENIITFNSSENSVATGMIYFTMNGQNKVIEIQLD